MSLDLRVEAVLFYKATPQKKSVLAKLFDVSPEALSEALATLEERLQAGATRLTITDTEVSLVTAPEHDELIEQLRKDELKRDIGKAGAETLAIVLYRGPVTRSEIDRIRGVNSGYILRNLQIRGLIERTLSGRQSSFTITPALLQHLGISKREDIPNYTTVLDALETYEATTINESS